VVPWPTGDTTAENLLALCRRHHRLKTHAGFGLRHDHGSGAVQVTTPWQRAYSSPQRE
jgi:hypothetical protein